MKLVEFEAAVSAGDPRTSWKDRADKAAAPLSLNDLAEILTTASHWHHDARSVLYDRLLALGAKGLEGRGCDDPETYLGRPWFVHPFLGTLRLHWCADATPSEDPSDWFGEDAVDVTADAALRVQPLDGGVTVVLTTDRGIAVVTTSCRCEPPAWFRAHETAPTAD